MVKNLVVTTTGLIVLKTATAITSELTRTTITIIDSIAIAIEKMRTLTKRAIITLCLEWIRD